MYGQCPICRKRVQLIYASPERKGDLVIGPHDSEAAILERRSAEKCLGSKKKPQEVPVALE